MHYTGSPLRFELKRTAGGRFRGIGACPAPVYFRRPLRRTDREDIS